mmetsp:Transcript_8550/g.14078  ORF Transcript_8550/g.14078 Transcript_8550/m.14078 type:complete len:82 (-) Transcript_8550:222-467(-)
MTVMPRPVPSKKELDRSHKKNQPSKGAKRYVMCLSQKVGSVSRGSYLCTSWLLQHVDTRRIHFFSLMRRSLSQAVDEDVTR